MKTSPSIVILLHLAGGQRRGQWIYINGGAMYILSFVLSMIAAH